MSQPLQTRAKRFSVRRVTAEYHKGSTRMVVVPPYLTGDVSVVLLKSIHVIIHFTKRCTSRKKKTHQPSWQGGGTSPALHTNGTTSVDEEVQKHCLQISPLPAYRHPVRPNPNYERHLVLYSVNDTTLCLAMARVI